MVSTTELALFTVMREITRDSRRRGVDGDGLAGGGADIASDVDDTRLISEARSVRGGRVVVAPVRAVDRRDIEPIGCRRC